MVNRSEATVVLLMLMKSEKCEELLVILQVEVDV